MSIRANWDAISEMVLPSLCVFLTKEFNEKISQLTVAPTSLTEELLRAVPNFSSFGISFRVIRFVAPSQERMAASSKPSLAESLLLTDSNGVISGNGSLFTSGLSILEINAPDALFLNKLTEEETKHLFTMENVSVYLHNPTRKCEDIVSTSISKTEMLRGTPYYGRILNRWHWPNTTSASLSKLSSKIQEWSLPKFSRVLPKKDHALQSLPPNTSDHSSPLDFQLDIRLQLKIECEVVFKGNPSIDIPGFGIASIVSLPIEEKLVGALVDLPLKIAVVGIEDVMNDVEPHEVNVFISMLKLEENQPVVLKLETILGDQCVKNTLKTKKIEQFLQEVLTSTLLETLTFPSYLNIRIKDFPTKLSKLSKFINIF